MTRRFDDLRYTRSPVTGIVDWLFAGIAGLLGALAIGAVLMIALGWPRPAHARWSGTVSNPTIAAWYKDQHNSNGEWCCDKSDGHEYDGYYQFDKDGNVIVELNGKAHVIPKQMVLTGPNPTGHAVWWFTGEGEGHRDYCFAPGTLS